MHPFVLPSMPLKVNLPGHAAALLDREPLFGAIGHVHHLPDDGADLASMRRAGPVP